LRPYAGSAGHEHRHQPPGPDLSNS
jgi:hypothetical protein